MKYLFFILLVTGCADLKILEAPSPFQPKKLVLVPPTGKTISQIEKDQARCKEEASKAPVWQTGRNRYHSFEGDSFNHCMLTEGYVINER